MIARQLSNSRAQRIYEWVAEVKRKEVQPILIGSKKIYKQYQAHELLTFRYPFTIGNNEYRILFVKVKNIYYVEFHLGNHKYYDKVRKELDLTKG